MPQFRLTKKFATDLKITQLHEPENLLPILDDWVIDVIRIQRKKVAMITHVNSLLTFLIPYSHVGGAANIPECIAVLLNEFIYNHDLLEFDLQIQTLFKQPIVFCKTANRKTLGHMNDFKYIIEACTNNLDFDDIDWDDLMVRVNDTLAQVTPGNYERPTNLLLNFLNGR